MAGMFHMALSRAKVTITHPDGAIEVHDEVTATLRDGVAKARKFARDVASMPATNMVRHSGKEFTITAEDGTTWHVLRDCGCGG